MTQRVFFALWPEADVAAALHATAQAVHANCGGRIMRPDTLHLTLAFLGDVDAAQLGAAQEAATDVAGKVGPGDTAMVLDRLGCWGHNRIVWAGCGETPLLLAALADALAQQLRGRGFRLDARPFAAHVSLLRNARCDVALPSLAELPWPVRDFVLVASAPAPQLEPKRPHYRVLRRWPLG